MDLKAFPSMQQNKGLLYLRLDVKYFTCQEESEGKPSCYDDLVGDGNMSKKCVFSGNVFLACK